MSTPDPGWYPDPTTTGSLRYFDGTAWTASVMSPPAPDASTRVATVVDEPASAEPLAHRPRRCRGRWLWIGAAGLVVVVAAVAAILLTRGSTSVFEAAVDTCGVENNSSARIGDAGKSLIIDHKGEDDSSGLTTLQLDCLIDALGAPESVSVQMNSTTAMQGRQSATWDGITASWTYHPDNGLDIIASVE